jgi:hypothetical protein
VAFSVIDERLHKEEKIDEADYCALDNRFDPWNLSLHNFVWVAQAVVVGLARSG